MSLTTGLMLSSRHHIHEWTMSSTRRLRTQVQSITRLRNYSWLASLYQIPLLCLAATLYLAHHFISIINCSIFASMRAILYTCPVNLRWASKFELFPFHPIIWSWLRALSNTTHELKSSKSIFQVSLEVVDLWECLWIAKSQIFQISLVSLDQALIIWLIASYPLKFSLLIRWP